MRALISVLALAVTPVVAMAQGRPADNCKPHPANRGAVQSAPAPGQAKRVCVQPPPPPVPQPDTQPPAPPPPADTTQPSTGAEIHGAAFADADISFSWSSGEVGLAGWSVTLSGPVSGSTVTDASGNYSFVGLPPGTYVVCEAPQIGWWQTVPMDGAECPSGMMGYTRVVLATAPNVRFIGNDFGNAQIQ